MSGDMALFYLYDNPKRSTMSKYGIFIIESLRSDDHYDGEAMSQILELSLIDVKYKQADTKEDFIRFVEEFRKSRYRYLHISCHADEMGIEINGVDVSYEELQRILHTAIANKRLFMSACKAANRELASRIIGKSRALSVVGCPVDLSFDKSALFWPAFYHVINEIDNKRMSRSNIKDTIQRCVDLFKVPINYYSRIKTSTKMMWRMKIRHDNRSDSRKVKITHAKESLVKNRSIA